MASDFSIRHAAHIIRHGGIIAYPTDTVYGLGCDPFNPIAVAQLNDIKQRKSDKQFILLASDIEQIKPLVFISEQQQNTIMQKDEPTSWIAKAKPSVPAWLCSDEHTLTFRISKPSEAQRLCQTLGHAIISTSANLPTKPPAKNALELHKYFHFSLDKILANNKKLNAKPSKIIRLCDNRVIRQ
ncbi:MAG: tRNA threonylcarbamoyladenosine biosynthesis protein RimN [Gammaproteobacteria bacterium]|nr:tRNA threonylcarbamoyladenosine biosynthesis protein RimN [Gammaproteobacteria bacterium]